MKIRTLTLSLFLASTALTAVAARADSLPPSAIGRISFLQGTVSTHGPNAQDWDYADMNSPVTTGDSFWTEPKGRSEIQTGPAEIRMDEATELDITRLDDSGTELNLPQGVVNIHLQTPVPGGLIVDTPQAQVILNQPGSYDIDVGDPGSQASPQALRITVLEGQAHVNGNSNAFEVQAGEEADINGNTPVQIVEAQPTPFDDWALSREHRERPQQALQYVSPQETGYQDLDQYGSWQQAPDYGTVWYPNDVPSNWAPYSDGRWDYVQPWGWTWVDNSPWGFTPFHYGRWVQSGGRWGWWPGEGGPAARPIYAPALVAFVGGGVSIGIGGGPVGWVPLAPYEVYHPWYNRDPGYWRDVNRPFIRNTQINDIHVTNNYYGGSGGQHNFADHYANAQHGATFVQGDDFRRGAAVRGSSAHVSPADLAKTPVDNNAVGQVRPDAQHFEHGGGGHGGVYGSHAAPTPPNARGGPETHVGTPAQAPGRNSGPESHIGTPAQIPTRTEAPAGAPGPHSRGGGVGAPGATTGNRTEEMNGRAGETPMASHAETGAHAPGPAIRGGFGHPSSPNVSAPNQEAPHGPTASTRFNEAPRSEPVTTPREREEHATPPTTETQRPVTQVAHPAQSAPLSATPHGWQRGNGGAHAESHPQAHPAPHPQANHEAARGGGDNKDEKH